MSTTVTCIICIRSGCNLVNVLETDCNNIQWIYKLNSCVPEIEWKGEYRICSNCIMQLDAACAFRELCLRLLIDQKHLLEDEAVYSELLDSNSYIDIIKDEFICFYCGENFVSKLQLIAHIKKSHQSNGQCNLCTQLDNTNPQNKCTKCNNLSASESKDTETKKPGRKRLDSILHVCDICGLTFTTRYLAKRHSRNVHATEKKYSCDICQQKFASSLYLNAHKRYHSRDRPHICSFCGKGFITSSDLYHHEKIHANKRAYKCDKCPKAFNTSSDLHKHKLCVHKDRSEWKYVCTFCNRRFPLKTNLDAHTKTHTGERNFPCHLCNHKCVNRSVLLRHIRSHSNVRLYKCQLCNMEYKYQKSLDIHMTKAHGIGNAKIPERVKKYFCSICPKSYFANNKLQKHIRTHTGERPFSCDVCNKRFIDKSYVKQHLKTAHNISFVKIDIM